MELSNPTVFVLGLGYVGTPLAAALGRVVATLAWDESEPRRAELRAGSDSRGSVLAEELGQAECLLIVDDPAEIARADFVIVCVPTPVLADLTPDLEPLLRASALVGRHLRQGSTVVFESTVYPGVTEEVCVPVLERGSGLRYRTDFHVAYSPERINPGDRSHGLRDVVKVVAASGPTALTQVAELYERVVPVGVYRAGSIRVAEAAKVLENVQRDVNIGLMNEFSQIMVRMGVDTLEVLAAAQTKWNFLPFNPGLVGGHCVAVDPYYLAFAARAHGVEPRVIDAARATNESTAAYWSERIAQNLMGERPRRVLVFGVTFKRDCADLRNSKVVELAERLGAEGYAIDCVDPVVLAANGRAGEADGRGELWGLGREGASPEGSGRVLGSLRLSREEDLAPGFQAVVLAVDHSAFRARPLCDFLKFLAPGGLVVDLHGMFSAREVTERGYRSLRP